MTEEQPDPRPEDPGSDADPDVTGGAAEGAPTEGAAAEDAAAERRTLCRSSTDKVVAGVAGGIGAYFGIDSVIVRIAFIVLTFLGGAGPFLYLIGWLALPKEDSRSIVAKALGGDSPHRFRSLMAVALIGLGLLVTANISGSLFGLFIGVWSIAPYLALILIAAGVALVLWPGPAGRSKPTPAPPPSVPPPPVPPPPTPAAGGPEWAAASAARPVPPAAPVRRQGRTTIGHLTVAILLVYTGGAVVLDRLDAVEVDVGVYFAIALAITGAGLVVSAFAVPARGLILLGVVLAAPLLLFVGAEVPWGSGVGEVRVNVANASELQDEYRHGVGQMVVDLRNLDLDGTDDSLELSLSVGEMRVYVPDNISTTADINVGAGNIRVWYGGPTQGRIHDLFVARDLLGALPGLPPGDELDDLESYLNAYERHRGGWRIPPEARQSLVRLFAEEPGLAGERGVRDTLVRLNAEARGIDYPWEDSEDGLGIGRTITVPVWDEPSDELLLDIDVGIGQAEVIAVPAPIGVSTSP